MKIIPAIDVMEGKCVRLSQGDYKKRTVYGDPLDIAKQYEDLGVEYLHLVDLEGAKSNAPCNLDTLEKIASCTKLKIDFGGGIKSSDSFRWAIDYGAYKVNVGTVAVNNPDLLQSWIVNYGANKVILGTDVKEGYVATQGWLKTSEYSLESFLSYWQERGIKEIVLTDISKDGMLSGPSLELYERMALRFPLLSIVASGGISSVKDLEALSSMVSGAILGKSLYEQKITYSQLKNFLELC